MIHRASVLLRVDGAGSGRCRRGNGRWWDAVFFRFSPQPNGTDGRVNRCRDGTEGIGVYAPRRPGRALAGALGNEDKNHHPTGSSAFVDRRDPRWPTDAADPRRAGSPSSSNLAGQECVWGRLARKSLSFFFGWGGDERGSGVGGFIHGRGRSSVVYLCVLYEAADAMACPARKTTPSVVIDPLLQTARPGLPSSRRN